MWISPQSFGVGRRTRRPNTLHLCSSESLELRLALSATSDDSLATVDVSAAPQADMMDPGGVTITDTKIITMSDTIPRFVAHPTVTAVRNGSWFDASVWSNGRVPVAGDLVSIPENVALTYASQSDVRLNALEISGALTFSPSVNTRMLVGTITVMPSGMLRIGSVARPVAANVKAEIVIADQPLNLAVDPQQYGTGLIVLGMLDVHGAGMNQTWNRLATELHAGDSSLLVDGDVSGWRAGDTLVIPDSRQYQTTDFDKFLADQVPGQWEEVTISRIVGNRVYLTAPLKYDHLGARNSSGGLELLPHVAELNRNVIIRSENPNGTRGHTLYTARADVDIEYARFKDLGRTSAFANLDNTTFDASGNVTHYGTNQIARYAVHFHHLMGPENPTNTGYQFKFIGNTVDNSLKWAVDVHGSNFGLLDRNVVYNAQGAGMVTENGSETGNVFSNNITIRMQGTHLDGRDQTTSTDFGRGGSGFWFRRGGNVVVGNVAADNTFAGFVIDSYFNTGPVVLPAFRGADMHEPGQGVTVMLNPSRLFLNNEAYGMSTYGMWAAFISGDNLIDAGATTTIISDLRLWNITHTGVIAYHTNRVTFNGLLILGNQAAQDRNNEGTRGMDLQAYENRNLVIRNSRIEGVRYGIMAPRNDGSTPGIDQPTVIENSLLRNYINILVSPPEADKYSNGNLLVVRNVKFLLNIALPKGPVPLDTLAPPANIYMRWNINATDYTMRSIVRVYDYNQVAGDDFQVFYREQADSVVMPATDPALLTGRDGGVVGAPVAGLTNAQTWARYGIATAGGLLPSGAAASRGTINGLIAPIQAMPTTPKLVLVTPWVNQALPNINPVRIRYNVIGNLPSGMAVYYSIDGGTPVAGVKDGGAYNVKPGTHVLRVYIGDAKGNQLAGTTAIVRTLVVTASTVPLAQAAVAAAAEASALDAVTAALSISNEVLNDDYESLLGTIAAARQLRRG